MADLLTLQEAAARESRTVDTIHYWHRKGIAGARLNFTYRGGKSFVKASDLEAFHEEVTARKNGRGVDIKKARKTWPDTEVTLARLKAKGIAV